MSPRRGGASADAGASGGRRRRGGSGRGVAPGEPRRPEDLGRTSRSHFRADGAPKTRFGSEADANRFALQVRLEHGTDLAAYRCELCGGWHLGGSLG